MFWSLSRVFNTKGVRLIDRRSFVDSFPHLKELQLWKMTDISLSEPGVAEKLTAASPPENLVDFITVLRGAPTVLPSIATVSWLNENSPISNYVPCITISSWSYELFGKKITPWLARVLR